MSTKVLLISAGLILTTGAVVHHAGGGGCPMRGMCKKVVKSEKTSENYRTNTRTMTFALK